MHVSCHDVYRSTSDNYKSEHLDFICNIRIKKRIEENSRSNQFVHAMSAWTTEAGLKAVPICSENGDILLQSVWKLPDLNSLHDPHLAVWGSRHQEQSF